MEPDAKATGGAHRVLPGAAPPAGGARVEPLLQPAAARLERASRSVARVSDGLLDFAVLAFAAWTVAYHVALVLRLDAVWAAAAGLVALVPSTWLALRLAADEPTAPTEEEEATGSRAPSQTAVLVVLVAAAAAGAALFAFTSAPWAVVWALWVAAALAALIATSRGGVRRPFSTPSTAREAKGAGPAWPETLTALAWAAGLAVLSLFLIRSAGDDAHYVHLSSWVAAHGEFPLRDVMFTDQVLPAVIFPPIASFEALAGTVAGGAGMAAPDLVYLWIPPLASALAVLATWRLLRSWRVRMAGVALSVAMIFLLLAAQDDRTLGNLFIGRIWGGKIVFLAVLVPLLFALLAHYAQQPTGRRLVLLAAAGTAGVGLSSTGIFVVPLIAAGIMAPLALRAARQALAGFVATSAYPLGAGVAILAVGGRNAQNYREADVVSGKLVDDVLGDGFLAFAAVLAVLVGPALIPRIRAARMTAATVLLVAVMFAPSVPLLVFRLTGLGEVLWRLIWAVPIAVLVGVLVTAVAPRIRSPVVQAAPAVLLVAALAIWGTPLWSPPGRPTIAAKPTLKRFPAELEPARMILAEARDGDVVLAPGAISQTILVLSGTVTTVASRPFYARALEDVPGGRARARLLLLAFAEGGLGPVRGPLARDVEKVDATEVERALRAVGVDLACVKGPGAERVLADAGYEAAVEGAEIICLRAPVAGSR